MGQGGRGIRRRQSFFRGALVLTVGMAAVKLLGALFKIPLTYQVGEYGMGLFHVAYHFFGPVFSLATAGFPAAVSRLVSESSSLGRWNDARQVKRVAMPLFVGFGVGGMVLMVVLAPVYCGWVTGTWYALLPMLALAPAIPLACGTSVYRGYYEGLGNMAPTATSQVMEALLKAGLGLALAGAAVGWAQGQLTATGGLWGWTPPTSQDALLFTQALGAAGAVLGVSVGSLVSLVYLALRFHFHGDGTVPRLYRQSPPARSKQTARKNLLRVALPIAGGSLTASAAGLVDATLLQNRLGELASKVPEQLLAACQGRIPPEYLGDPQAIPTYLYGCYTLAMTIYLLVPGITQAFATSALPSVTGAWARGNKRELRARMETVVRVTALFCFPAGVGLSALAHPIALLLYGDSPSAPLIGDCLQLLGIAALGAAMSAPLSSMLQAVGRADLPVKLLAASMVLKLAVTWVASGIPQVHVLGAAMGTLVCYLFLTFFQFWQLRRVTGARISLMGAILRPLSCGLVCGAAARAVWSTCQPLGNGVSLLAGTLAGGVVYFAGMLVSGGIPTDDLQSLPWGQKIAKMLEKRV